MADLKELLGLCAPGQVITDEDLRTLEEIRKRTLDVARSKRAGPAYKRGRTVCCPGA